MSARALLSGRFLISEAGGGSVRKNKPRGRSGVRSVVVLVYSAAGPGAPPVRGKQTVPSGTHCLNEQGITSS